MSVLLNYDDCKSAGVPLHPDLLTDFPIVTFGEGNFTFSIALANIREGWDELAATCLEEQVPEFDAALNTVKQHRKFDPKAGCEVSLPETHWIPGIDATQFDLANILDTVDVKDGPDPVVLWFQCPYISLSSNGKSTLNLIQSFIAHAHLQLKDRDGYVCIGIVTFFPYTKNYGLQDLLGLGTDEGYASSFCSTNEFDFVGASREYARRLLDHGYKHQGNKNIHSTIKHSHLTLIFKKKVAL